MKPITGLHLTKYCSVIVLSALLVISSGTACGDSSDDFIKASMWLDFAATASFTFGFPGDYDINGENPVCFFSAPSSNDPDGGVIRSRYRSQFCDVKFQEWSHHDGVRVNREQVGLIAMEEGRWNLGTDDDVELETGSFNIDGTGVWKTVNFSTPFNASPQVIISAQTAAGADAVMTRINNVTTHSFDVALFEEENNMQTGHALEKMAFLAVYSPRKHNLLNYVKIEIPYPDGVKLNHDYKTIDTGGSLINYQLRLEEDQSFDTETSHADETVHFIIINDIPLSQVASFVEKDPVSIRSSKVITSPPAIAGTTSKLNDTGRVVHCDTTENIIGDCAHGRDAQFVTGILKKVGAGRAGFDFTKLDANGDSIPASANHWSCVRDNHTGMVWEIKTDDGGIHDKDHRYRWGGITAFGDRSKGGFYEDWNILVNGSNNQALCGKTGWRVPTPGELLSLRGSNFVKSGLEANYFFTNIDNTFYWTAYGIEAGSKLSKEFTTPLTKGIIVGTFSPVEQSDSSLKLSVRLVHVEQ
ncbi:MAG: DUF1566 domain-containing protein [Methylococcales bacterium]